MCFFKKVQNLKKNLKKFQKVLIAFSGGKDSFFLLRIAIETLGDKNVFPVFIKTNFNSKNDEKRIEYFYKFLNFNLIKMNVPILKEKEICLNSKNRCYLCKKIIFLSLKKKAKTLGIKTILDGTTFSDLIEFRPGLKALDELQIISPLRENKITSAEIVNIMRSWGIDNYYLTSSTCLATRFPYDMKLDQKIIEKFDKLETFFIKKELYPVRVRYIPEGVRIEIDKSKFQMILKIRDDVITLCKKLGFKFITFDLEGIKSGIWD